MSPTHSPYLTEDIANLFPDPASKEFWDRCTQHVLAFQRCTSCGTYRNPPAPLCYVVSVHRHALVAGQRGRARCTRTPS